MKSVLVLTLLAAAQAIPWVPEPRDEEWWFERHRSHVENSERNANNITVIFYGDSITEAWSYTGKEVFDSKYAPLGAANYGIGSDRTEHLLYRIADGEVAGLNPKVVVLKIGTNNAADPNDDTVKGIKAVVDLLLERLPNTRVLLLGLLPKFDADSFRQIADINIKISKFHDGNRIHFLDMWLEFATSFGVCNQQLFSPDQIHLEAPGYQKWAETMDKLFNELINSLSV